MDVRVNGHQVETGEAFRTHADDRLQGIAQKYFSRAMGATVTLAPGPHDNGFRCDIVLHVVNGLVLKGSNSGQEAHVTFDGAAEKIEKQLRRYSRRLKDRQGDRLETVAASPDDLNNARYSIFRPDEEEEVGGDAPLTIAETRVDVPEASVGDAVMMLDLRNTTALLFKNSGTGQYNMVYRRDDGNIGWVEPH